MLWHTFTLGLLVVVATADLIGQTSPLPQPSPPVFPSAFEVQYTFSLPYVTTVQSHGLSYPVHVWLDNHAQAYRIEYYDGLDALYLREPLPDLRNWTYAGTAELEGQSAYKWVLSRKSFERVASYTFYTSADGAPLRIVTIGRDLLSGAHFDEYVLDFTLFKAGPLNAGVFDPPSVCSMPTESVTTDKQVEMTALPLLALLGPLANLGLAEGNSSPNMPLGASSMAALLRSKSVVDFWQKKNLPYTLELNRFASWPEEQFDGLMRSRRRSSSSRATSLGTFESHLPRSRLPKQVDWRGSGMDMQVKDQATCGSCWAFAATGAMEASWFMATGEVVSLSEQQLVDCSWDFQGDYGGCGGADTDNAIEYVAKSGGIALEEEYQYMGQDAFCRSTNTSRAAFFRGFKTVRSRDEAALMEAVASHGPIAVSIDAANETFKFYSEGVYVNPECHWKEDELDHAVLLVGYGTSASGEDYWLIRNSWSKYWGEDGYVKISRRFDCGVTTSPVMAVADKAPTPHSSDAVASSRRR